ncbi:alpha/beta hydrolase [Desulforhopalus sp. IMCC35007]|uniref:alpha/beta hydrolase n=1 Tax=Desulforhopalus sp. IMCC35007 TaxID=2569543 RepID=UPI0010AE8CFC|nr:dienelactone hydrolase family protein [Desulforhopalus sp. IMCC35007]TKB08146.1 carboxylesterase [Desulforhopalus sp. IMCC35007]
MTLLAAIETETQSNPTASVIWLHGLGADGNDFAPIVPELAIPEDLPIRFIFPHAPSIPVTVNGGFVMPAWYDILEMEIDRKVDTKGLLESVESIKGFIDQELARGIESQRIVIAGFSQGGAVAYHLALSYDKPLAGLLAMSTYFATADSTVYSPANSTIPIEIHHGKYDPVVPEALAQKAITDLRKKGYSPKYKSYPMEHSVCPEQIADISKWLQSVLRG